MCGVCLGLDHISHAICSLSDRVQGPSVHFALSANSHAHTGHTHVHGTPFSLWGRRGKCDVVLVGATLTRLREGRTPKKKQGIIASHDDQSLHQLSSIGTPKGRGRTRLVREDRRRACGAVAVRALLVSVFVAGWWRKEGSNEEEEEQGVWVKGVCERTRA